MPELPEMERYKNVLSGYLAGKRITDVEITREKSVNVPVNGFLMNVQGHTLVEIRRRHKHLIFVLDNGKFLLLHLMLGGWMFLGSKEESPDRTKQITLSFGEKKLFFIGLRLGYLHLLDEKELTKKLENLGAEPFDPKFDLGEFTKMISRKKGAIKSLLIDPKFIAGIGNCYSDEICFQAGLKTSRKASELTEVEISTLYHSIQPVLRQALEIGGYMDEPIFPGDMITGKYNERTLVYDQENKPCKRCGSKIVKEEISSRKTFFCPHCQK